uniref:Uncharacterized protein n=1 Tax=Heterorhabditis bacteriophora TaxID=37862 RepID=A0A1I7WTM4_HETBA
MLIYIYCNDNSSDILCFFSISSVPIVQPVISTKRVVLGIESSPSTDIFVMLYFYDSVYIQIRINIFIEIFSGIVLKLAVCSSVLKGEDELIKLQTRIPFLLNIRNSGYQLHIIILIFYNFKILKHIFTYFINTLKT